MVGALAGCGDDPAAAPAAPPPRNVEITTVAVADIPVDYTFVGRTASSQRVEIRARVDGYLDNISFTEGTFVEEGALLFEIDPLPYEAALRAARAELAEQEARLENAEALLRRIEPLVEAEAIAQKELDDALGQVNGAKAAVEAANAKVFQAELDLGYTTIESPVSGLTSQAQMRKGAYLDFSSEPLTYVAKIDPIWIEFSISETQFLQSNKSRTDGTVVFPDEENFVVSITLADGTEYPYTGRISFADASLSEQTGTFLVRAVIDNPEQVLRPGQYVNVTVRGAYRPEAIALPQRALRQSPKGAYVWLVNSSSQAQQQPVVTGPWTGDLWIVEQGLMPGDRVIVDGTVGLQAEMPVQIVSGPAGGNAEAGSDTTGQGG